MKRLTEEEKSHGEDAVCHEPKSHRFISISPPPPRFIPIRSWTRNPSIITCHWNRSHRMISILIIMVSVIGKWDRWGGYVMSFPQGAPPEVCMTMEPRHFGTKATSSSSDYYLTASSSKFGGSFGVSKSGGIKGVFSTPSFILSRPHFTHSHFTFKWWSTEMYYI